MTQSDSSAIQMSLEPLGAGDLIDRSLRFYRKNFWTFFLIAAPPVILGTLFFVGWTFLAKSIFSVNSSSEIELTLYGLFLGAGNIVIWLIQTVATLVVMGGASRNFVRHLLYGEQIKFSETYRNAKSRLLGLVGISSLITVVLGILGISIGYFGIVAASIGILIAVWLFQPLPIVAFILSLVIGLAIVFGTLYLLFLVISRFVYIPQVMMVEGQGAFAAINRSMSLAGKNVNRVAMLFIFTFAATYSALAILYIPLGWYAWVEGIQLFSITAADSTPAWYQIATQVISQTSLILLTPIWMIGLCLLYIDERVRKEGYDVELLAARRLGDIPNVPEQYVNPLQPALSAAVINEQPKGDAPKKRPVSGTSTLGLK
ncbi:MAG: hypothetical protein R2681_10165 [Pyrinomonadaceae bacterium]